MAKKVIKQTINCRDCKHSYDWHERNIKGEFFMCRCKFYTNGKYCKFLDKDGCEEHFERR